MREKDYNTGLRGVLFEARHCRKMGAALWLYGWLVLRQTRQQGSIGWVLGGAPISYREIEEETGFNCRTLERWMRVLRRHGYVETEAVSAGVIVRITKAKKFPQAARRIADGVRNSAGGAPQSCVANRRKPFYNERIAEPIGSSSIAGSKDKPQSATHSVFHNPNRNPNGQEQGRALDKNRSAGDQSKNQKPGPETRFETNSPPDAQLYPLCQLVFDLRLRQRLLRAEREEAVRRELAVGTGPEVRRS